MSEHNQNLAELFTGANASGQQSGQCPRIEMPGLIWFYGLWVVIAMLSDTLGHSTISRDGAVFMLAGIVSTNFFFLSVAYSERKTRALAKLLALYQTIMAIAWTSAFLYFSSGAGEIALGMYLTALMFAVPHVSPRAMLWLVVSTVCAYALILGIELLTMPALIEPLNAGIRFIILCAGTAWIYMFARRLRNLRFELQYRNEELQTLVDQVTRIAAEDDLTKSYNRRYIMDVLARERAQADRSGHTFSVLLFDLDHFKRINDRYGHLVGDEILSEFARVVKNELRGMDAMRSTDYRKSFGRYGGEEFLAILPGSDIDGAQRCAERCRKAIENHEFCQRYSLTVSVGCAEYEYSETIPQLLKRTDEALYCAKREGRNCVRTSGGSNELQVRTVSRGRSRGKPKLRLLK